MAFFPLCDGRLWYFDLCYRRGTRANIIIAFALFLFIGIVRGWITLWMLIAAGVMSIVGMFWLALKRYGLDVSGAEAFYTFYI